MTAKYLLQECKFIFEESDLIITQHISNMAGGILGTENLLKMIGKHTEIVYIPNLWFDGYFPQHRHPYIKIDLGGRYAFPYADSIIDELIKRYSVYDVIKIIKSDNFFLKKFLRDFFEYRISDLAKREKQCDIKMLDYVISNWKKELLFYSVNHPSNKVIFEETKRLLNYLGYSDFESERIDISELNCCQVIIYPSVKLNYGLEFTHNFYTDVCFEGKADIDEYIMQYVSYIHPQQLRK